MFFSLVACFLPAVLVEHASFSSPFDQTRGVLGWMTPHQIGKVVQVDIRLTPVC